MTVKTKFRLKGAGRDSYLGLVTAFPLASIKSEEQLQEAQKVMDRLLARGELDDGEEMYLDALSDLVAVYEDEHYPIEPASGAEMLRHLMEAKGITQAQLSRDTTVPKSTISEILAGKKSFSHQLIREFADYFRVDARVLTVNRGTIMTKREMKNLREAFFKAFLNEYPSYKNGWSYEVEPNWRYLAEENPQLPDVHFGFGLLKDRLKVQVTFDSEKAFQFFAGHLAAINEEYPLGEVEEEKNPKRNGDDPLRKHLTEFIPIGNWMGKSQADWKPIFRTMNEHMEKFLKVMAPFVQKYKQPP
jgi:HTH-type transcriptional regulator/antitoxin HigA